MAYQAKRSKRLIENLELVDEQGVVKEVIHIDLDPDAVVKNVSRKYTDLLELQVKIPKTKEQLKGHSGNLGELYENLGRAFVDLMEAIMGAENTEKVLKFYENRLMEMSRELSPFFVGEIIPQIRKMARKSGNERVRKLGLRRL